MYSPLPSPPVASEGVSSSSTSLRRTRLWSTICVSVCGVDEGMRELGCIRLNVQNIRTWQIVDTPVLCLILCFHGKQSTSDPMEDEQTLRI